MCPHHGPTPTTALAPTAEATAEAGTPPTTVDHIGLSVHDLEASVAFYRTAFGLAEEFRFHVDAAAMTAVVLRSPHGWAVELLHRPDSVDPAQRYANPDQAVLNRGYGHLCLRVQDLDGDYQRVLDAGATVVVPPGPSPHPAVRFGYLADPEGNLVELIHVQAGVELGVSA